MQHTILGAGPVGQATATALARRNEAVRLVSRRPPKRLPAGVEHRVTDVLDRASLHAATAGSDVIYQCLNAPYHRWKTDFPPLQQAAVDATRRASARLVSFENLYLYGAPTGAPFGETTALAACSRKGQVRLDLAKALLGHHDRGELSVAQVRASDLFGPGMHLSALGEQLLNRACAGQAPRVLGNPDVPHTWTFVPDAGETLARVGLNPECSGKVWHVPSAPPLSQRAVIERLAEQLGRPLKAELTPKAVLWLLGWIRPEAGELLEMLYEFERPFVMGDALTRSALQQTHTPFDTALAATVASITQPQESP